MSNNSNAWLKDSLDKIENKIDKLDTRIDNVDVTLAKQSVILEEHTRRSTANEEQVELLKKKLEIDLKPLQDHLTVIRGIFKAGTIIISVFGVLTGIIKIVLMLK
jgi:uncharacterized coiled-coil protein SlyX